MMKITPESSWIWCLCSLFVWTSELPGFHAQDSTELEVSAIAENLTVPWDLVWGPDNHIWCMEKSGRITRIHPDLGQVEEIHQIPGVYQSFDNSGAHGMVLHPDFPVEPFIYVNYTYAEYRGRLSKLTYSLASESVVKEEVLLNELPGNISHNGSRLLEGPDGYLYFSTGDAFVGWIAQELDRLGGKVLRMDWNGDPVPDNPFDNLVYSYGHRNPQGLVFAHDGQLYSSEHGPANDDEVNRIVEGGNYGWPLIEGYCDTPEEEEACESINGMPPLAVWSPTQAPCGLAYFNHPSIPEWSNSLLLCFLRAQQLKVLALDGGGVAVVQEEIYFKEELGRLRDVLVAPNGRVFLATSNREINGWDYLAQDTDDRILEVRNVDYVYEEMPASSLTELFLNRIVEQSTEEQAIFPQPADYQVHILIDKEASSASIRMYDMLGRVVLEAMKTEVEVAGALYFPVSDISPGSYVVEIATNSGHHFAKPLMIRR